MGRARLEVRGPGPGSGGSGLRTIGRGGLASDRAEADAGTGWSRLGADPQLGLASRGGRPGAGTHDHHRGRASRCPGAALRRARRRGWGRPALAARDRGLDGCRGRGPGLGGSRCGVIRRLPPRPGDRARTDRTHRWRRRADGRAADAVGRAARAGGPAPAAAQRTHAPRRGPRATITDHRGW